MVGEAPPGPSQGPLSPGDLLSTHKALTDDRRFPASPMKGSPLPMESLGYFFRNLIEASGVEREGKVVFTEH